MNFLILYRNQYKNLKKDKRKKTRILQIFFLLVLGIWEIHSTEAEYREAFFNRIKGLSDNAEQFDSSHYYYQELAPTIESNITNHGSNDLFVINCSLQNESGETINLPSSLEHPSTYRNGEYCVTITSDRGSISKVTLNTREIDLSGFRRYSKQNIMQASLANLDDLKEKVRAGNIYGYSQETWLDESTGLSFTVQNNIRKNIKIRSMALCFSEEERTTDIYFDVCSKENESEFFDPIKKSITTLHDELPSPSNFPKDIYVIKNGDTISRLKKEGKLREVFKNQSESNVRSLWIKNSSFQKRVKNNGIMYIATQLPNQYRYGELDIDFKSLLTEGNVVKGQYFILDGATTSSYSESYLYKKANEQLFCVKLNNGKIKYTDSTDLEWLGSAENPIEYLTKDRPLLGASQTGSHNVEGFYQISGRPIGQMQNWLIFKNETNPSALFSTEFPCISVSDFSPDTFKNDQKKDEEIAFIKFLSDWDLVQSIELNFDKNFITNKFSKANEGNGGIYIGIPSATYIGRTNLVKSIVERALKFFDDINPSKISIIKSPQVDFNIWSKMMVTNAFPGGGGERSVMGRMYFEESLGLLKDFFTKLKRFNKLREIDFEGALQPLYETSWLVIWEKPEPIIDELQKFLELSRELKVLKMDYSTYEMIKNNTNLITAIKRIHLHLHHIPHGDKALKEDIKNSLSGGEVTFHEDPPSSGCVIS